MRCERKANSFELFFFAYIEESFSHLSKHKASEVFQRQYATACIFNLATCVIAFSAIPTHVLVLELQTSLRQSSLLSQQQQQ